MKSLIGLAMLVLLLVSCTTVPAGHVGIVVNNYGTARGVQDIPTFTGFTFYNPISTDVFVWPTSMQTVVLTASVTEGHPVNEEITFTTKDKMKVSVDASLSYLLISAKVPQFYVDFRSSDMNAFTHGFLHNVTRDAFNEVASSYIIDQIMGDNAEFISKVQKTVSEKVSLYGVDIRQFGIIGAPRPPESVIKAIDETQKAKQQALTTESELRNTQAAAAKQVAAAEGQAKAYIAVAQGLAEANRIKSASITPQIMEWERLGAQRESIGKWNGILPATVLGGNTPMILSLPTVGK